MTKEYNQHDMSSLRGVKSKISPLIKQRWSPRAYTGEKIPQEDLLAILEAGRLAPSAFNRQPWRLIYAHRETKGWDRLFNLLMEKNQQWVKDCSVLMLILCKKPDSGSKYMDTTSFDCGACWMSMALEAFDRGYPAHGMSGFNYQRAREEFTIPEQFAIEAMVAMGVPKSGETGEEPNGRMEIDEFAQETERASKILTLP